MRPCLQIKGQQFGIPGNFNDDIRRPALSIFVAHLQIARSRDFLDTEAKSAIVTDRRQLVVRATFIQDDASASGINVDAPLGCGGERIERLPEGSLLPIEMDLRIWHAAGILDSNTGLFG